MGEYVIEMFSEIYQNKSLKSFVMSLLAWLGWCVGQYKILTQSFTSFKQLPVSCDF